MALVKIENLTYYYPGTEKPALDRINLSIPEGQFVLVIGGSGSGKSSLLRVIAGLIPGFYGGKYGGRVYLDGTELRELDKRSLVQKVGIVFQDPEAQMVMTGVEQEIAFGLENLGLPPKLMRRRVMEVTEALSLTGSLSRFIPELSGGEKQKVALASVLAMQPEVLLLDEPTSQLDPVAGEEILTMVRRLNEENGITVVLIEQRLERCFHLADRVLVMDEGRIVYDHHAPEAMAEWAVRGGTPFVPPLPKLFASVGSWSIPVTVKEGRRLLRNWISNCGFPASTCAEDRLRVVKADSQKPVLEVQKLWFIYPSGTEVLKSVDLDIQPGKFVVIMGENGAGKTTLLKNINGLLRPSRGRVIIVGRDTGMLPVEELAKTVGYLSQNPNDYLFMPTVRQEIEFTQKNLGLENDATGKQILNRLGLETIADRNPRDLSTGERQRVALASVLAARPELLLLDEPTRGLDYRLKEELGGLLLELKAGGATVAVVTHDVEFAAEYADEIVLMAAGEVMEQGSKYDVLTGSTFYSPQLNKLFHNIIPGIVTFDQAREALASLMNCVEHEGGASFRG
ncbi:ABC transporter related protein [Syntrophothermus lipocalidus DSM 12680]|uniref:ABC transporter related protein n=1 Tax=Syntrophothermus lipocalidus (strain DSM 12680 / TGB-C1) TaxID=643648 RepID=D7CK00_SYNLT|nr:ABC transporter ATP-binding protein [Syntrophothermus lipocalidus]ADI01114.1 ABC transporter related protein [Syntrophothermus lipocalidus DSM 12680]